MNAIFDSVSALQRFRNRHALQVSSPNHMSNYILNCKVKKILNKEFTDEVWDRYLQEYGYVEKSRADRLVKLNQFVLRLDKLDTASLKVLLNEYDNNGVWGVVALLSQPISKLIRLTKSRYEEQEPMY